MKKRVLTLLLALVMAFGLCVPALAAEDVFQAEEPAPPVEEEAPVAPVEEEPAEEPAPAAVEGPEPAAVDEPVAMAATSGTCGAQGGNLIWSLSNDGTLTISGTGAMADYDYIAHRGPMSPWYEPSASGEPSPDEPLLQNSIQKIVIGDGVTSIGSNAFAQCPALETVAFGKGVKSIGSGAFLRCDALESVLIPTNVPQIYDRAFAKCGSLTSVTINNRNCEIHYTATAKGNVMYSDTLGVKDVVTVYGQDGSTAQSFAGRFKYKFEVPASMPWLDDIEPPKGGTGWRYVPELDEYYYFHNYERVGDYWIGFADGASAWADNWYYADATGKLLTGFRYLDDLQGGKAWYMLQVDDTNGTKGKMLTGFQWTWTNLGVGFFEPGYGSQGKCTFTDEWGFYDPATGLWQDGYAHIG